MQKLHHTQQISCLEIIPCSDNPVLAGNALMPDTINTVTGDTAVDKNLVDSLAGDLFPRVSSGCNNHRVKWTEKGFSIEEPSIGLDMSRDQPPGCTLILWIQTTRGWKLMSRRTTHALRTLWCCLLLPRWALNPCVSGYKVVESHGKPCWFNHQDTLLHCILIVILISFANDKL